MKRNIPEVPTIDCTITLDKIEKKICRLDDDERETIKEILLFHGCEASAAAERISELLGVSFQSIYEII